MTTFTTNLAAIAKAKGWKTPDLNQAVGKKRGSPSAYKWLNGSTFPSPRALQALARAAGVTVEDLTKSKPPKAIEPNGAKRVAGGIALPTTKPASIPVTQPDHALTATLALADQISRLTSLVGRPVDIGHQNVEAIARLVAEKAALTLSPETVEKLTDAMRQPFVLSQHSMEELGGLVAILVADRIVKHKAAIENVPGSMGTAQIAELAEGISTLSRRLTQLQNEVNAVRRAAKAKR